jgi:hypothetical protein
MVDWYFSPSFMPAFEIEIFRLLMIGTCTQGSNLFEAWQSWIWRPRGQPLQGWVWQRMGPRVPVARTLAVRALSWCEVCDTRGREWRHPNHNQLKYIIIIKHHIIGPSGLLQEEIGHLSRKYGPNVSINIIVVKDQVVNWLTRKLIWFYTQQAGVQVMCGIDSFEDCIPKSART